ncbi:radical SAM protein [Natranaerofaba carboxydovora]|uniref:radical SAM protein n=1 Tax=Natranaerofaba carboxydovora TaxID=2742683 RepID=UPI001F13D468|nr:radical SAM protein [Natranaerofaba carboxydovora]UMZ72912.1 Putative mycofactocin radical SAM maturase MftC [Natranaerofaba carboxydovora]
MALPLERGKRLLGEKIFQQVINYLEKDPYNNLNTVLDLVQKAPVASHHKEIFMSMKEQIENSHVKQEYVRRIFDNISSRALRGTVLNFFLNSMLLGVPKQYRWAEELGVDVPYAILIDPTSRCNLNCIGCWAGAYDNYDALTFEEVDRIITEAKELGIYLIAMSGGEPYLWPDIFKLFEKHDDVVFMTYTNGTLFNKKRAKKLGELGNVSPAISIEGWREVTDYRRGEGTFDKIMQAMDNLREEGVPFGFSVTLTSKNCEEVMTSDFIDLMVEKGALYGWSFHYIPIGKDPDFSLMLSAEQRRWLVDQVRRLREEKPIQFADFWNDGVAMQGCIAGGRRYFHITSKGDVEPCAFIHFSTDNIKGKSLKEVLQTPLFKSYQKRQPFSDNMLRPCPLIDVPHQLREIIKESGAEPTHPGADDVLKGMEAEKMEKVAASWEEVAEKESLKESVENCRRVDPDECKRIGDNL